MKSTSLGVPAPELMKCLTLGMLFKPPGAPLSMCKMEILSPSFSWSSCEDELSRIVSDTWLCICLNNLSASNFVASRGR